MVVHVDGQLMDRAREVQFLDQEQVDSGMIAIGGPAPPGLPRCDRALKSATIIP
jgi:hypothetical protein